MVVEKKQLDHCIAITKELLKSLMDDLEAKGLSLKGNLSIFDGEKKVYQHTIV